MNINNFSDFSNSAVNPHNQLDCSRQVHPKTPNNLPNNISKSIHVQPNLGIPLTRGFKIASINLASLFSISTSLGSICCPRRLIY